MNNTREFTANYAALPSLEPLVHPHPVEFDAVGARCDGMTGLVNRDRGQQRDSCFNPRDPLFTFISIHVAGP